MTATSFVLSSQLQPRASVFLIALKYRSKEAEGKKKKEAERNNISVCEIKGRGIQTGTHFRKVGKLVASLLKVTTSHGEQTSP